MDATSAARPSSRPVVLVVEDNPDHALLVQMAAAHAAPDVEVRLASTGEEALAVLGGHGPYADRSAHPAPGLVILDLLLPGMGGLEVLGWISGRPDLVDAVPVVVLTSSLDPRDRQRALDRGAADVHVKPPDVVALGRTVRTILEVWLS